MSPFINEKKNNLLWLAVVGFSLIFVAKGCSRSHTRESIECSLVELRKNVRTQYYDAVVRVENLDLENPSKSRFYLVTPTSSSELTELIYTEDGADTEILEPGDTFIVPLQKPDWKFSIRDENEIYCSHNFWDQLPVADQWHPTKSEAMRVALSLEIQESEGFLKPLARNLPVETVTGKPLKRIAVR